MKAHWEDILEIYHGCVLEREYESRRELMSPGGGERTMNASNPESRRWENIEDVLDFGVIIWIITLH